MAGRIILDVANPALTADGQVDADATLTFYQNSTTTLQTIYTAADLLTPLANPLTCDAAGRFPTVWAPDLSIYSVKWTPSDASPITFDDIAPSAAANGSDASHLYIRSQTTTNVAASSTQSIFRFLDNAGSVIGTSFIAGIFLINVVDQATGGNSTSAFRSILATGNASSDTSTSIEDTVVRGAALVSSFQLQDDGSNGGVQLAITTAASGKTVTVTVTFIGVVS